jgi:hypothetical protein
MSLKWQAALDPNEKKDYVRDWSAEMDAETDTIASAQFVLPQSAQDATLTATSVTIFDSSKKVRVWFEATDADTFRSAFLGKRIDVDHSITSTGGRRFNETIELKIREK